MATDDKPPGGATGSEPVGERVRIFRRGTVWCSNFQQDNKQHRVSLRTRNKKDALRRALKLEAELGAGMWKPAAAVATVEQAVAAYQDYLRAEDRAKKTLTKYAKVFERVAALARQRKVRDLTGIDLKFVDAYRRARMDDGTAARTRYTETVILRQLINFALTRDMIGTDPLKGLKLEKPTPTPTPQPCWTLAQVAAVLAVCPAWLRPPLTLLAETGLRFGELAWLTWRDIDRPANLLRVQAKEGWKPKAGDQRAVPLSPPVHAVLAMLPATWPWVVTMPPSRTHPKPGRQWTERRRLAELKRILKPLGLTGKLHTFRHSFISNALLRGTAVAVVKEWVGHVDDEILGHYTHVHDGASQAAMQRLAGANRSAAAGETTDDRRDDGSARIQHTAGEGGDGRGAK